MRKIVSALALAIGALALAPAATGGVQTAFAQAAPPPGANDEIPQIVLTEAQVKQYIAAQAEMEAAAGDTAQESGNAPDPKTQAKLEATAKKFKFASFQEFNTIAVNIGIVLAGVDPQTKTFVGAPAVIKQEIAEVKADDKMKPADKKETIDGLNEELKSAVPVKNHGNIDLVLKYYDSLADSEAAQSK